MGALSFIADLPSQLFPKLRGGQNRSSVHRDKVLPSTNVRNGSLLVIEWLRVSRPLPPPPIDHTGQPHRRERPEDQLLEHTHSLGVAGHADGDLDVEVFRGERVEVG